MQRHCVVPVNAVDEAILHLDSQAEPWSVHLELEFSGRLDVSRLRPAVHAAVDRHPRARSKLVVASPPQRGYAWQTTTSLDLDPLDVVECDEDDGLGPLREELLSRPISLDASPPLRVRLVRCPSRDVVLLAVHHAAGDAMGALVFLQSVARAYAGRPEAVPGVLDGPPRVPLGRDQLRLVMGELSEAFRPSARLAAEGGREAPGYTFLLLPLDAALTRALRDRAGDGTTVNDLLVAALHLSVARWNAEHGERDGRLSVLMPVNLRPRQHWREGFENRTFMVAVATLPEDRLSAAATVDAVRRRTRQIKEQQTPAAAASWVRRLHRLPLGARRWLARQAARERVVPTTILSNLGAVEHDLDFGPGVGRPVDVWFSPPARMPLGLAIGALTVDGMLHVAFRARHPLLGPQALDSLASSFESALGSLVRAGRPSARRQRAA